MLLLQQKGDAKNDWQCHLDMYLATVKQDTEGPVEVEKSDHVPDRILAERIGRAKGRAELAGSSVPADLIMEIKETALRASIGPWFVWQYCRFVKSLPGPPRPLPAVRFSALGTRPPHVPSTGATATPSNTVQPAELKIQKFSSPRLRTTRFGRVYQLIMVVVERLSKKKRFVSLDSLGLGSKYWTTVSTSATAVVQYYQVLERIINVTIESTIPAHLQHQYPHIFIVLTTHEPLCFCRMDMARGRIPYVNFI